MGMYNTETGKGQEFKGSLLVIADVSIILKQNQKKS